MANLPPEDSPYPPAPDASPIERAALQSSFDRRRTTADARTIRDEAMRQVKAELRRVRAEGAQFNHPVLSVPAHGGGQNLPLVEFTFSISNGEFVTYSIPAR